MLSVFLARPTTVERAGFATNFAAKFFYHSGLAAGCMLPMDRERAVGFIRMLVRDLHSPSYKGCKYCAPYRM
jgi:hypothetical protein